LNILNSIYKTLLVQKGIGKSLNLTSIHTGAIASMCTHFLDMNNNILIGDNM